MCRIFYKPFIRSAKLLTLGEAFVLTHHLFDDPTFFTTENGIKGGLTALYSHLRDTYGQAYYYNNCETGTDEYTWAQSADGNFKDADLSGVGNLTSMSCRADALWGNAFNGSQSQESPRQCLAP